ncbi:heavy-metal-associated domain-containing protein [Dermatophilus congolensis]|uniref:Copper chaperone n=1 Tax=Dermatophilus congolensis TaxID=1863 RepID=A0A239V582_9MICO|nr:heavy-metal-associated domain-containing protein [Dermatophilus congolensis]MBO3130220.1 heavy-metal-associated domain-containing protein [Dermatophilus congolensis]MBO3131151.1 heavy-metal-associated domain-containing protein [Dermatophilus congolensis]MBO3134690.1 heavy-metal-associated domain-containing protein [Dermatophilus congolensis]MBO3136926.1 heavy-metal-associated domain-containing protein [Dermatophilus congolensis]MBO3139173.1 heavy-metal-associated domain-containing protein [
MNTTDITISGMTCGHCTSAVTSELLEVENISGVDIVLVAGGDSSVKITHEGSLDEGAVRAAVAEAGDYSVSF